MDKHLMELQAAHDQAWAAARERYGAIERMADGGPIDEELARMCFNLIIGDLDAGENLVTSIEPVEIGG